MASFSFRLAQFLLFWLQEKPKFQMKVSTGPTRLKFWGVRGSIPTPGPSTVQYGGNTSCLELRVGSQIIVLDAGTGLRLLGRQLVAEFGDQPLEIDLLLTHTHWDHIQGLPFFLPVYQPKNRLRILGYEGARHGLDNVLTSQMESPFFPIGLREVPANVSIEELKDLSFELGPVQVKATVANHPGNCMGYRLFTPSGSVAFFPDNESYRNGAIFSQLTNGGSQLPRPEEPHHNLTEFLRDTDVLVMDAQYDWEEYETHVGWGHGCVDDVVALALKANVKRLFLFHHDPEHDDAKISEMAEQARKLVKSYKGSLEVHAAREGETVAL